MSNERLIKVGEKPLQTLISTHMQLHQRIFNSTNILLTVTSIIFSVSIGIFTTWFFKMPILVKTGTGILILSSAFVLILCLLILRPELKHKKPITEFYYMDIFSRYNKQQYIKRIKQILKSDEKIIKFYIDELYELGKYVLLPNFKKIKLASEILIIGIIISLLFFILSFIKF